MSMLDSFFSKGFKAAKCKTLLKLSIPRIKLLRNRREIQIKQMRRDIAKLLETGQEATARIRVEHIIREENMMAAQEIVELFCELIAVRLPIIEVQRECPLDLKEAISSICFAAPRCADLPELLQVQLLFASKYGKEFVSAATELMPGCGVNRQLIELLSIRAPSSETKLKLLKEIAEEHDLDWDPAATEMEFSKRHEDLLNGPTQFGSGSVLPLPKEKHVETVNATPDMAQEEESDSETGFDTLDFPEVPKVSLRPNSDTAPVSQMEPSLPASTDHAAISEDISTETHFKVAEGKPLITMNEMPTVDVGEPEEKQFVPFISPHMTSPTALHVKPNSLTRTIDETNADIQDVLAAAHAAASPTLNAKPVTSSPTLGTKPISPARTRSETSVDLQDVLAAAHAAAETAERAAAAARSAANLAQARISELTKKSSEKFPENGEENPFYTDVSDQANITEKPHFDHQHSFGDHGGVSGFSEIDRPWEEQQTSEDILLTSFDKLNVEYDDPPNHQVSALHQPQRLPSMDDESYFSYPNLFRSQSSNNGSGSHSASDNYTNTSHNL